MESLPDVSKFKSFKLNLFKPNKKVSPKGTKDIDLNSYHFNLLNSKNKIFEEYLFGRSLINISSLYYELYPLEFLRSLKKSPIKILNKFVGYSQKYNSLSISIFDENENVKTIAIRRAYDMSGNRIKWKTYGSKMYVPYKIKDDPIVFIAVGMSEYVFFEMIDVSYILLQSDGMYKHINEEIIKNCIGKTIIIYKENDPSFESLIPKLCELFSDLDVYIIDFESVLNKKLLKGYDLIDFVREIKCASLIEKLIENEILRQMKEKNEL